METAEPSISRRGNATKKGSELGLMACLRQPAACFPADQGGMGDPKPAASGPQRQAQRQPPLFDLVPNGVQSLADSTLRGQFHLQRQLAKRQRIRGDPRNPWLNPAVEFRLTENNQMIPAFRRSTSR